MRGNIESSVLIIKVSQPENNSHHFYLFQPFDNHDADDDHHPHVYQNISPSLLWEMY